MSIQQLQLIKKKTLVMRECPEEPLHPGEMRIDTAFAGICRTDRKSFQKGQKDLEMPRILGHEITGIIREMANDVKGYSLGEKVHIHPGIACGICPSCRSGNDQLCDEMRILGFHLDGGFSQSVKIPSRGVKGGIVQKVPPGLPLSLATLTEPLACIINLTERLQWHGQTSLLLIGGGVLGILTALLAKIQGVDNLLILEKSAYKRKVIRDIGFQCLPHDANDEILRQGFPYGFDVAIPCCPGAEAFSRSLTLLKKRGKFGFFSGLTTTEPVDTAILNLLHYKELSLYGSYGCALNHSRKALAIIATHPHSFKLPVKFLNLEEAAAHLGHLETEDTILAMIRFKEEEK